MIGLQGTEKRLVTREIAQPLRNLYIAGYTGTRISRGIPEKVTLGGVEKCNNKNIITHHIIFVVAKSKL